MNKNKLFIEFLESLEIPDQILFECIKDAYSTIFESFTETSAVVLNAYNQLINITEFPENIGIEPLKVYKIVVLLDNKPINIIINTGINSHASYPPSDIELFTNDLWMPLLFNNFKGFIDRLKTEKYRHIITHELSHIYDFSHRTTDNANNQIHKKYDKMRNMRKQYSDDKIYDRVSDLYYHNHRTETIANLVSLFSTYITNALSDGIDDANNMFKYVIDNIKNSKEPLITKTFNVLSNDNKHKFYKKLANAIHDILSNNKSNLGNIIKILSENLKNA